ncbi:hypothetical protein ACOME3_001629 [Neoechinorhynchus agilis]
MSPSYDTAITVFSPDGHLFQVEYAQEAVKKGSTAVGVRGSNVIALAVERKAVASLQEDWTIRKICSLDEHVALAFAGLTADARVLVDRARVECQSHRLSADDPVRVEYITKYIASIQQAYTQGRGRRPFGLSALITGFDFDGTPHLFQTDPSGTYNEWKAAVIGRSAKNVLEYLEKNYKDDGDDAFTVKLCVCALSEVAHCTSATVEIAILRKGQPLKIMDTDELDVLLKEIEKEKQEEAEERKRRREAPTPEGETIS